MNDMRAVAEAKVDLTPYGYTPGTNFFYCGECSRSPNYEHGNWPYMGAAGSTRCITHALQARQAELLALEGQLICEFGRNPIEIALYELDGQTGRTLKALTVSGILALIAVAGLLIYCT